MSARKSDFGAISARHEGHHHHGANIKYGYIIFGLSIVYYLVRVALSYYDARRIRDGKNSGSRFCYKCMDIVIWLLVSLVLSVLKIDFPEQYVTAIKRFGRLAYCLLPLDILLALRPNLTDYMGFLMLHKWISRLIIGLSTIHSVGYFYKWASEGGIIEKTFKLLNFLGVIVFAMTIVLVILSIRAFRRYNYRTFYVIHNLTMLAFVMLIMFHARPSVSIFTLINVILLCAQIYLRFVRSFTAAKIEVKEHSKSSLQLVKLSRPASYPNWMPCSHIRISSNNAWFLASHPYTISSLAEDDYVELIIRKTRFQISEAVTYQLSNPFPSLGIQFINNAECISIICGGSGISFGLSLLKHVKLHGKADISLIWCTRTKEDLFILNEYPYCEHIKIFITKRTTSEYDAELNEENIEMQSILSSNSLIDDTGEAMSQQKLQLMQLGRPKLMHEIIIPSETTDTTNWWLAACGPDSLVRDVRTLARTHNMKYIYESFNM